MQQRPSSMVRPSWFVSFRRVRLQQPGKKWSDPSKMTIQIALTLSRNNENWFACAPTPFKSYISMFAKKLRMGFHWRSGSRSPSHFEVNNYSEGSYIKGLKGIGHPVGCGTACLGGDTQRPRYGSELEGREARDKVLQHARQVHLSHHKTVSVAPLWNDGGIFAFILTRIFFHRRRSC